MEYRFAERKSERLPKLAAELVRLKVDLIVASGDRRRLRRRKRLITNPIVMTNSGDPMGVKFGCRLARPGGNLTGLSSAALELNTKRLEMLKDAMPKLARVGFMRPRGGPFQ